MRTRTKKPLEGRLAGLEASTPFDQCPLTGSHCSVCGQPQRRTHGGDSCSNGHGGAGPLEDTRAPLPGAKPFAPGELDATTKRHVEATAEPAKRVRKPKAVSVIVEPGITTTIFDPSAMAPAHREEIPTGGNPSEPDDEFSNRYIDTIATARAFVGVELWDLELVTDRAGHYMNPGEHAEDCPVKLGAECECAVGYVQQFVKPDVAIAVSQKVVGKLTLGQAIEMGYKLDVSFEERIAGDRDSVIIHVPVVRHLFGVPESRANESVTEEEITNAVAALKKSAERSKAKFRIPKRASGVAGDSRVSFVAVDTRVLLDVTSNEQLDEILVSGHGLDGAIVKVNVPVPASKREAFDGAAIKAQLVALGASAVMLSPRIVSDTAVTTKAKLIAAKAASPEDAIREWFAGQVGLTDKEHERAVELALEIMEGT